MTPEEMLKLLGIDVRRKRANCIEMVEDRPDHFVCKEESKSGVPGCADFLAKNWKTETQTTINT